jgi:hypothetical protein
MSRVSSIQATAKTWVPPALRLHVPSMVGQRIIIDPDTLPGADDVLHQPPRIPPRSVGWECQVGILRNRFGGFAELHPVNRSRASATLRR